MTYVCFSLKPLQISCFSSLPEQFTRSPKDLSNVGYASADEVTDVRDTMCAKLYDQAEGKVAYSVIFLNPQVSLAEYFDNFDYVLDKSPFFGYEENL